MRYKWGEESAMKKFLIVLSVLLAMSVLLAGCSKGKSEFGIVVNEDRKSVV